MAAPFFSDNAATSFGSAPYVVIGADFVAKKIYIAAVVEFIGVIADARFFLSR